MKNAKKFMALILGVIMTMGCLSVSAANNDLTVTENPAKMIYESISEDFQKWFAWNSTHSCFHGNLINTKMQEWINLQKKG